MKILQETQRTRKGGLDILCQHENDTDCCGNVVVYLIKEIN